MTKRTASFLAIFSAIILAALYSWYNFLNTPVITQAAGYIYKVRPGSSYKVVSAELHEQKILKHPFLFDVLFTIRDEVHKLKAGEYLFPYGSTPSKMIDQMISGTGLVYHTFTIVPGMTFRQMREVLNKDPALNHLTQNLTNDAVMKKIGEPNLNPEGRFFPDTYYFTADSTDVSLLKRAFVSMQQKILKNWGNRAPNLPFRTPYEALIAASIIEKEAYARSELPVIAGVMVNRLHKGIVLQFDPTVIYGMGERFNGTIYRSDLQDKHNTYNSYVYKGLPPTPISMPGLQAIEAVMHPSVNNYLYFVATGDGMTHQFSATLAQHDIAVKSAKVAHPQYFNHSLVKHYVVKSISSDNTN